MRNLFLLAAILMTFSLSVNAMNQSKEVTPREKSDGSIVMNVEITLDELISNESKSKKKIRKIKTSASFSFDEILALGGLLRDKKKDLKYTPILPRVSIIGWFSNYKKKGQKKRDFT